MVSPLFPQFKNMPKHEREFLENLWRRTGGESDRIQELETLMGLILASSRKVTTFTELMDTPSSLSSGDIFYANNGAVQRLAKGTNGEVVRLASGLPEWASQTGIGAWEQIERSTFSDTSSESIGGSQTPSDYDLYRLVMSDLLPDTDGAVIDLYASADGGTTKKSDYSRAGIFRRSNNTGGAFGNTTATSLPSNAIDTGASSKVWNQNVELFAPGSSNHKWGWRHQGGPDNPSGANIIATTEHFWVEDTDAIDSWIMEPTSGTVSGNWALYGLKKTP